MSRFRPSPEEERWSALVRRLGLDKRLPTIAGRLGHWTRMSLMTRVALFILGSFAAALVAAIFSLLHVSGAFLVAGVVLVGIAESLIVRRRLFGSGIEEALELAGLLMITAEIIDAPGDPHFIRLALVVAAVFAVAGFRLLNPLLTTLACLVLSYAVGALAAPDASGLAERLAGATFCYALAALALVAGRRNFRRPSYDRMLDFLVVAMPLAGYLWVEDRVPPVTLATLRTAGAAELATLGVPLAFALATLAAGLRRRRHAPLLAFLVCVGCIGYGLRALTGLALEARLIVWGAVALGITVALDRWLRTPRRGITSGAVRAGSSALALLELAGAARLAPPGPAAAPAEPSFKGGGGTFGGGGASGDY